MAAHFRISRPAISKHVGILQPAGLIAVKQEGTSRYCRLTATPLQSVHDRLTDYEAFWDDKLQALARFVEDNP